MVGPAVDAVGHVTVDGYHVICLRMCSHATLCIVLVFHLCEGDDERERRERLMAAQQMPVQFGQQQLQLHQQHHIPQHTNQIRQSPKDKLQLILLVRPRRQVPFPR